MLMPRAILLFRSGINKCLDPSYLETINGNATVSLAEMRERHGKAPSVFRLRY